MSANIQTFYLLHHTHTDIGFTHDQPIIWELHRRFLDRAIDFAERDLDCAEPHAFRWTAEALAPVLSWWQHANDRQRKRFLRVVQAGRIEVTAMYLHNQPLADSAANIDMLQHVALARDLGIPVKHAMNCDINGHNWPLVDALLDAGIESLTMAINEFNGGAPFTRPNIFRWQAPTGRNLLALNNWIYNTGNFAGISPLLTQNGYKAAPMPTLAERLEKFSRSIPALERMLARSNWQLPIALVPCIHFFGDNAPPDSTLSDVIREWNRRGEGPRLQLATPDIWWNAVRSCNVEFPVAPGDWTDYWSFGVGASAREVAVAKAAQTNLEVAGTLYALTKNHPGASPTESEPCPPFFAGAWDALQVWNEHTFESDAATDAPDGIDSAALWNHKAHQAWQLHSLAKLLLRDTVADLALQVRRAADDLLFVYNPLPWQRTISGPVRDTLRAPRGDGGDPIATRHYQDHDSIVNARLKPLTLPPLGYAVVTNKQLAPLTANSSPSQISLANDHHKLIFDTNRGGILSWSGTNENWQWLDDASPWRGATLIREEPVVPAGVDPRSVFSSNADEVWTLEGHGRNWLPGWKANREATSRVISHLHEDLPDGQRITQRLGFSDTALPVAEIRTFLPDYAPWVEFEVQFEMGLTTSPEAYYFALPFAMEQPSLRFDAGNQAILLDRDQLPGTNRDYFTNQKWCALTDAYRNILVATPVNPLVMFGGFHFGDNRHSGATDNGLFLGWLTNNYWLVNYAARQPGRVIARYRVCPQQGGFDESAAHRFGLEAATPAVLHNLMEPPLTTASLPPSGSLLQLPEPPIISVPVNPRWNDNSSLVQLRLTNASAKPRQAVIGSGLLKISSAQTCDFFGKPLADVPVKNGQLELLMQPRDTVVIRLKIG
ncbi:MAG: hypothetical protein LBH01_11085 [Verrucomicrobiales bacterium]|jgi:hypothetical protein|nr:hypothetical protein [Verrucomicrobiales bacterium]